MALIIEDGTGVANANSYATTDQLDAYAALRGVTLAGNTTDHEHHLIHAMDWLEAQERRFYGSRLYTTQALAWPRINVPEVNGEQYRDPNVIPAELIKAQCALAVSSQSTDLQIDRLPGDTGAVLSEKVGSLAVTYADPGQRLTQPTFATAEGFLVTLVRGGSGSLRLVRG